MAQQTKVSIDRETIVAKIQERVLELTYPELTNLTEAEKNKQLKNIESVLNDYLTRYEKIHLLIT